MNQQERRKIKRIQYEDERIDAVWMMAEWSEAGKPTTITVMETGTEMKLNLPLNLINLAWIQNWSWNWNSWMPELIKWRRLVSVPFPARVKVNSFKTNWTFSLIFISFLLYLLCSWLLDLLPCSWLLVVAFWSRF